MSSSHTHRCPRGCDECLESDCARRRVGVIPACACACHVRCFRLAQSSGADLDRLDSLRRVAEGVGTFAEAREVAGLSLREAARWSAVDLDRITALEAGAAPTADEWALLAALYASPSFSTPPPTGTARAVRWCADCHHVWCAGDRAHHARFCTVGVRDRAAN